MSDAEKVKQLGELVGDWREEMRENKARRLDRRLTASEERKLRSRTWALGTVIDEMREILGPEICGEAEGHDR